MSSGWETYYVVLIAALLALVFPLILRTAALLIGAQRKGGPKPSKKLNLRPSAEGHGVAEQKINPRYFLAINVATLLLVLAVSLLPISGALKSLGELGHSALFLRGLFVIVILGAFLALGLLYAIRKGDLSWSHFFKDKGK